MNRPIRTRYFRGKHSPVRETAAGTACAAVPNAVMHMQLNHYDATECEVWNDETGELHAVIRRSVTGRISILFNKQQKEGV